VLPEYRKAAARGQIEISTTPYYHPILPLLCDTDIARVSNPHTPLPHPGVSISRGRARAARRARKFHERVFGKPPVGLWPSEGSVSDQALEIAMELGFKWFATDEGVLGRTRNIGFWRDAGGYPENGVNCTRPGDWRGTKQMSGFFRDHYLSDLVGSSTAGWEQKQRRRICIPADSRDRRTRTIGGNATVSLILDGENAWEYYPGNGRDFCVNSTSGSGDPDIRALTASEAMEAARSAQDREHLPGLLDQREFRRLDRPHGRRARVGLAARCARGVSARRGAAQSDGTSGVSGLVCAAKARL
jgi:alpha-amylase/alpha-mannosidase (GH57 family)